jgi:uncharacterized YigZ family protein
MDELYFPLKESVAETEVKKSKFLGFIFPVENEKQVKEKIEKLRKEHKKAAHIAYAFASGDKFSLNKGFSDDGEPAGTAGRPLLSIIESNNYTNILAAVVRYFGGVKLGTGGLVKAYSFSFQSAIKKNRFKKAVIKKKIKVSFPYEVQSVVSAFLEDKNIEVGKEDYAEQVDLEFYLDVESESALLKELNDKTSGLVRFYENKT